MEDKIDSFETGLGLYLDRVLDYNESLDVWADVNNLGVTVPCDPKETYIPQVPASFFGRRK